MKKKSNSLKEIYNEALVCEMPIMVPHEQRFHFWHYAIPKDAYNYIINKKELLSKHRIILTDIYTNDLGKKFLQKIARYCLANNIECGHIYQ